MFGEREMGVDELETPELGAGSGSVWNIGFAEFGAVAIGDDGEGGEEVVSLGVVGEAFHAEDLIVVVWRGHDRGDGGFEDGDIVMSHGGLPQLGDEAAVVETSSFWSRVFEGIGYFDWVAIVDHVVSLDLDRINLLQTVL